MVGQPGSQEVQQLQKGWWRGAGAGVSAGGRAIRAAGVWPAGMDADLPGLRTLRKVRMWRCGTEDVHFSVLSSLRLLWIGMGSQVERQRGQSKAVQQDTRSRSGKRISGTRDLRWFRFGLLSANNCENSNAYMLQGGRSGGFGLS